MRASSLVRGYSPSKEYNARSITAQPVDTSLCLSPSTSFNETFPFVASRLHAALDTTHSFGGQPRMSPLSCVSRPAFISQSFRLSSNIDVTEQWSFAVSNSVESS